MRAKEFTIEQILSELAMGPNALRKLASKIQGALCGMEFEMYVPNVKGGDEDEQEPDYSNDPRTESIDEITSFFYDGDFNGRNEIKRLRENLHEEFNEWASDKAGADWDRDGRSILRDYMAAAGLLSNDTAYEQAKDELGDDATESEILTRADELVGETFDEEWESQGDVYEKAYDDFMSSADYEEDDWLRYVGYYSMSDIESNFGIMWPIWSSPPSVTDIPAIAEEFETMIGRNVNYSSIYHGGQRDNVSYVVEPDGSLTNKDSDDDAGLEFVSPPLPIDQMLSDLAKVKAWADKKNCYTNDSTGLHINVSVPGITAETLDYVKLAILLGDQYVLEQFGRTSNTYCQSSLKLVKRSATDKDPSVALKVMDQMRTGLNTLAAKAIHNGQTGKFVSIHPKEGYIEFRSPGGDWLDENFDKIESTLLRTVVALDASIKPDMYRKEYLTKLYKLLKVQGEKDPMSYFAKYAAGELPAAALKSFIKQIQLTRQTAKDTAKADADLYTDLTDKNAAVQQPAGGGAFTGTWRLLNAAGNEIYRFSGVGNSQTDANRIASNWLRRANPVINVGEFDVVPEMR
jgi:Putative amidoligase enzyme